MIPCGTSATSGVEAEFDHEQDRISLNADFDCEPPAFDLGRMVLYKAMCDLLWTL